VVLHACTASRAVLLLEQCAVRQRPDAHRRGGLGLRPASTAERRGWHAQGTGIGYRCRASGAWAARQVSPGRLRPARPPALGAPRPARRRHRGERRAGARGRPEGCAAGAPLPRAWLALRPAPAGRRCLSHLRAERPRRVMSRPACQRASATSSNELPTQALQHGLHLAAMFIGLG